MAGGKKAKNAAKTMKGKAKEATGKVTGNESLEMKGKAEQMAGDAGQAGQKAKDTLKH
ncbi:CsbD family protein [Streptomyces sp. NPDC035033]|uniref:CsbD family protein n=1 Tax=Streptomyces sp. NPDC035033 TaxID=3155368 RepID=UPI0033C22B88